jgi:hypothetical protein
MASKSVKQFVNNLTHAKGYMGDFAHAARTFVDDDFRLAPKLKFQYHVVFSINPQALKSINFKYQHQNEINMLVKSADLPKFSVSTETLNQYNRKKVVQNSITYSPVNIKFHEDNFGVVRQLWQNYYSYYYADHDASKTYGNYNRTAMLGSGFIRTPYGLDNGSSIPFFNNITIYQFARRTFTSAKLINPVITAWNHDTLDYSNSSPSENSMTLAYEAVNYDYGQVEPNNPPGFGVEHYDTTPSPLSVAGGGTRTVFGPGGVLAGAEQVFGAIASGRAFDSPLDFLNTAIKTVNTYQNAKALTKSGVNQELQNIATKGLQNVARTGAGSINNTNFPVNDTGNANIVVATPRNINGGGP